MKRKYPKDIDLEIVPLLDALNALGGIRTRFSCSGHGTKPFWVHLTVNLDLSGISSLSKLARHTCSTSNDALSGRSPCRLLVEAADLRAPGGHLQLRLTGPKGTKALFAFTAVVENLCSLPKEFHDER